MIQYNLPFIIGKFIFNVFLMGMALLIIIIGVRGIIEKRGQNKSILTVLVGAIVFLFYFLTYTLAPCASIYRSYDKNTPAFCQFIEELNPFYNNELRRYIKF